MRKSKLNIICIAVLLTLISAPTLITQANSTFQRSTSISSAYAAFSSDPSYQVSAAPTYIQEGLNTTLAIKVQATNDTTYTFELNVTNPAGTNQSATVSITTNAMGFGEKSVKYWGNFSGASTNFVGPYQVALINQTTPPTILKTTNFTVGLTDKTQYQRNDTVFVQATGYHASEVVTANIKTGGSSVANFPRNFTANSIGNLTFSWKVPLNATPGAYNLTLTSAKAGGTVKTPADTQVFKILGLVCKVQTINLAKEPVKDVLVDVYKATNLSLTLMGGSTNSTGWVIFNLDSGNYTFKAFVGNVEVKTLANQTLTMNTTLKLQLLLVNVLATVKTQNGEPVPLVDIALEYNSTLAASSQTTLTGVAIMNNLFTNRTYIVEAERFGMLFRNTTLPTFNVTVSPIRLNLTLPSYTLNVHVLDGKGLNASGIQVYVYEWETGVSVPINSVTTNTSGYTSAVLPFGRYVLQAYKDDAFLNETVVNLNQTLVFTFGLDIMNLDVKVTAVDYFGQPIPNAQVTIERKVGEDYAQVYSQFTGSGGSTVFASILGGDCRISVYVAGKLAAVQTQYLGTGSTDVTFQIGRYVEVLGNPVDSGLLALFLFIVVLLIVILVLTRHRWLRIFRRTRKK